MNKLLTALVLAAACCGTAYAQAPEGMPPHGDHQGQGPGDGKGRRDPSEMIKRIDKNNDGAISKAEAAGSPFEKRFDAVDANKDGKVTAEEIKSAPRPERGERGPRGDKDGKPAAPKS